MLVTVPAIVSSDLNICSICPFMEMVFTAYGNGEKAINILEAGIFFCGLKPWLRRWVYADVGFAVTSHRWGKCPIPA